MSLFELDLHLFDAQTIPASSDGYAIPSPVQVTTQASLSDEMKTYYEDRLLDNAEPYLVYDQFGDKYPIPQHGGKIIEFRKFEPLDKALTALTEGVTPQGNSLEVTTVSGEVEQFGDYITISDVLDLTAIDRTLEQATKLLGSQAGRTLDTITRDIVTAGTNVMRVNDRASRADVEKTDILTPTMIFKAAAKLLEQNATPIGDSFVAVIHPNVACDLMTSDAWLDVHKYATPENIYNGEIGKIGNVRFVQTTEAKVFKHAGKADDKNVKAPVYATMVFGSNAYAVTEVTGGGLKHIVKPIGTSGASDPLDQRGSCGWKAIKTAIRLVEQNMVRIEHGCSTGSATIGDESNYVSKWDREHPIVGGAA